MSLKVVMFPGQGSQYVGMGEGLFAEFPEITASASGILGYDIAELCLKNPDNSLSQTNFTQPALYVVNHLHYKKYLSATSEPDYLIGHSLGEFNALNAAGVFDFETGLKIVHKRGELMFSIGGTSMAAIIGADYKEVRELLKSNFPDIDIANINSTMQIVISGKTDSLNKSADLFEEEGLVYVPLKVSGGFHSRYMTPVKDKFREFVAQMEIRLPKIPVISNFTAAPYPNERESIVANITNQLDNPIKWLQCVEYLMYLGDCRFVETGPGEVLSNIIKKISI